GDRCPRSLDCTLMRRDFCIPGSDTCGPCLEGFEEDSDGTCYKPSTETNPDVESEIDFIAAQITKQDSNILQLAQEGNNSSQSPSVPPPDELQGVPAGRSGTPTENPDSRRRGPAKPLNDALILGVVVGCTVAGLLALFVALICWCKVRREIKLAEKTDYTTYKLSPPPPYEKTSPGDNKLAQSAQMYHYQHQKQQMISMDKNKEETKHGDSAVTSDEENEDGDFTVYECPGLAPTGEMEVKNPLFDDSNLHHPTQNNAP
ncbi:hypothetical protein GDO86_014790, partial [Hymenochirus boettgeri]